jgi:glutamate-1-semialdehyde 2,1-aminomutase
VNDDPTGALARRAARVLAGGATHSARSYPNPIHVAGAKGARKWLIDGREMVDYTMGHGALLLGHAHPAVVEAVRAQVARGTHYGAGSELEVHWAELVADSVPSVERVRFTTSGTEAVMLALRLARAASGRSVVVKLDDHFNGWYDAVSVNLDGSGRPLPSTGVAPSAVADTRVIRAGDLDALSRAVDDGSAAALIMEASGAHYGRSPLTAEFIAEARRRCDATGTALVFDEVVTGFRVDPGGMQALLGIRPDMTIFGKVMAGGLPGGAVGGRAHLMDLLAVPEPGAPPTQRPFVYHPGTWNANPLTAAAGIATLELVADGTAQARAAAFAAQLEAAWSAALGEAGVPGRVWRLTSIIHCALDDAGAQAQLGAALRDQGIDVLHTSAFCSTAHGDAELEWSDAAFRGALRSILAPRS